MTVGAVTKYNGLEKTLFSGANRQWDNAAAGNLMFILASAAYTPLAAHATTADLTGVITSGNGAPIAATGLAIDNTTTPGSTYYKSADADFGATTTITAKFLIAVEPAVAGAYNASTDKLLFYVDLNTATAGSTVSSAASSFIVYAPVNGWFKTT